MEHALSREASPAASHGLRYASESYTPSSDGTRIHHYAVGEGTPAMVCCDGLGCDGYVWRYVVERFAPRHRVVRFHYRAHGTSATPADPARMRVSDLCDDLEAVMAAEGLDDAVLLGHSLGVPVMLEFQRRHPEKVRGLVALCGTYGRVTDTVRDHPLSRKVFGLLDAFVKRVPKAAQFAWQVLDTELAYQIAVHGDVNGRLVRREDFRPYLTHLARMDLRHFFTLVMDAGRHDLLGHLDTIRVPTLIFAGERDTYTPPWLSDVMHARIPGSELTTVPGGTHTAPIEMPELVTTRIARWLDEHGLGAP
jgi:pimeloyl-ACP methyl ester carboxylesterase